MWRCDDCGGENDDGFKICWSCRANSGPRAKEPIRPEATPPKVIVTTTPTLETHDIVEYFQPVFGETVWGANILQDLVAGFTEAAGGRSETYETLLDRGRREAIMEMMRRAERMGANAVVGFQVDYESRNGTMFLVCASGTAVRVRPKKESGSDG